MTPLQILTGDCRETLRTLPDCSVQTCVTSPPYFGLRDYGTRQWRGGDPACKHEGSERYYTEKTAAVSSAGAFSQPGEANKERLKAGRWREGGVCVKCGAQHFDPQIGLEKTPDAYVAELVQVFREVRRVLRDDGTLWLNLGDSYSGSGRGAWNLSEEEKKKRGAKETYLPTRAESPTAGKTFGLKPKDLIGIPWRVAFALQADGAADPAHMRTIERVIAAVTSSYETREEWPCRIRQEVESLEREWIDAHRGGWFLRQDIIWHKPNTMPNPVKDRCTTAHEYIFLLSKSIRYYYDADAIAEKTVSTAPAGNGFAGRLGGAEHMPMSGGTGTDERWEPTATRNRRSVWTVTTKGYSGAHFATFPPELIRPCIIAGAPVGGVVLDPFGGSGTTGQVAIEEGRRAILCELNPEYVQLIQQRTSVNLGLGLA